MYDSIALMDSARKVKICKKKEEERKEKKKQKKKRKKEKKKEKKKENWYTDEIISCI